VNVSAWNHDAVDPACPPAGARGGFTHAGNLPEAMFADPHISDDERRDAPRYSIAGQGIQVRLAQQANGEYVYQTGLVVDVGMHGVGVLCDARPGPDREVYLWVEGSGHADWSPGQILSFRPTPQGPHLWGLYFPDGCPYDLFKTVLHSRHQPRPARGRPRRRP
jgi:hypothetical protein